MTGRFVPNPRLDEHLLRSTAVRDHLEGLAQDGAEAYREGVPVDSGDLIDSVFGDVALTAEGFRGRIGAKAPHAGLVELGTIEHAPNGALRAVADRLGVKLEAGGSDA